jgi:putative protease
MELVSPGGSLEKLRLAYQYGADAVYIGLDGLSLRSRADNFSAEDIAGVRELRARYPDKHLYCALNILMRPADMDRLFDSLPHLSAIPFDAFIVSDPGAMEFVKTNFPQARLHLSTQASCSNALAAKFWRDQGFSRVVLSRELSLSEIGQIKRQVPDLEIEAFCHGAMCVAYSGRCLLSAMMANRSANSGACAHTCRWKYRLIEEEKRPGEPLTVVEANDFSYVLASRDLCMIDRLEEMREAGIDALKIEGRMKSSYYVAAVTRAYRAGLSSISGQSVPNKDLYKTELGRVSHRPYSTGFYYGEPETGASISYERETLVVAVTLEEELTVEGHRYWAIEVKNGFSNALELTALGPEGNMDLQPGEYRFIDEELQPIDRVINQKKYYLECDRPLGPGFILLKRDAEEWGAKQEP